MPSAPRGAIVGLGVLVLVAAVLGLRAAAEPVVPAAQVRLPLVHGTPVRPSGPFDHLPGRTPIPAPTPEVDRVGGELPPSDGPGEAAARRAVRLVLGRYCLRPDRYEIIAAPLDGWLTLGALAVQRYGGDRALVDVSLVWTGHSYRWTGIPDQLSVC